MPVKPRNFVHVGDLQKIGMPENIDFIINLQKSMLLSLVKRKLLTPAQMDSVMIELDKKYRQAAT
jgi:hypothetical protein